MPYESLYLAHFVKISDLNAFVIVKRPHLPLPFCPTEVTRSVFIWPESCDFGKTALWDHVIDILQTHCEEGETKQEEAPLLIEAAMGCSQWALRGLKDPRMVVIYFFLRFFAINFLYSYHKRCTIFMVSCPYSRIRSQSYFHSQEPTSSSHDLQLDGI